MRFSLLAVLLFACGTDEESPPDPPAEPDAQVIAPDAAEPDASTEPALTVLPPAGPVMRGQVAVFTVTAENFQFVDPTAGIEPADGQGHYHFYVDDDVDYTAAWTRAARVRTSNADAPGEHTVRFVLVNGLHEEIEPLVETTSTFTIQ